MTYTITKSKDATSDGLYIYCFTRVPQVNRYIKIDNLFLPTDDKAIRQAKKIFSSVEEAYPDFVVEQNS